MMTVQQLKELLTKFPDSAIIKVDHEDINAESYAIETYIKNNKIEQVVNLYIDTSFS